MSTGEFAHSFKWENEEHFKAFAALMKWVKDNRLKLKQGNPLRSYLGSEATVDDLLMTAAFFVVKDYESSEWIMQLIGDREERIRLDMKGLFDEMNSEIRRLSTELETALGELRAKRQTPEADQGKSLAYPRTVQVGPPE